MEEEPIIKYINETWRGHNTQVSKWDQPLVNWIFTLHAGGIAGGLTFAASEGTSPAVFWSLVFFSAGLVAVLVFGAIMFYDAIATQRQFREVVRRYYSGEVGPDDVFNWQSDERLTVVPAEVFAWVSGALALPGIGFMIGAIT